MADFEDFFKAKSQLPPSSTLVAWLAAFRRPGAYSEKTFIEGIQSLVNVANLTFEQRKAFYGDPFLGIHYETELSEYYNQTQKSDKPVTSFDLQTIIPEPWENYVQRDINTFALVYQGCQPSLALDALIKGPTVIDCGMFCQLALWFGIRKMLGDVAFNALFGKAPFYITQGSYHPPDNPLQPLAGNPLGMFLDDIPHSNDASGVWLEYIENTKFFPFKHPGGVARGHNCIRLNGLYAIFSPRSNQSSCMTKEAIQALLEKAFNAEQNQHDRHRLQHYATKSDKIHPDHNITYQSLIKFAEMYQDVTLPPTYWKAWWDTQKPTALSRRFDIIGFIIWLQNNQPQILTRYQLSRSKRFCTILCVSNAPIVVEDLKTFDQFRIDSPLQKKLYETGMAFSRKIAREQTGGLFVSATPQSGKTVLAQSCAHELSRTGKQVAWIEPATVKDWIQGQNSLEAFNSCIARLKRMGVYEADVIIVDDLDTSTLLGKVLCAQLYNWYIANPNKGLLITSRQSLSFEHCFEGVPEDWRAMLATPRYDSVQFRNIDFCDVRDESTRAHHVLSA